MNYYRIVLLLGNVSTGLNFLIRHNCIMCHPNYTKKYCTIPFRTLTPRSDLVADCPEHAKIIKYREIPECFLINIFKNGSPTNE